jgi:hypothetical protein
MTSKKVWELWPVPTEFNPVHTTVYWKKIVNGVSTDVDIGSNSNRYGGSTVNSPSLIISNAVTSDEGFYVCYATNSVGTGQSSQTFLDVRLIACFLLLLSAIFLIVEPCSGKVKWTNDFTMIYQCSSYPG